MWRLVSLQLNFFTPNRKPVDYVTMANGKRRRIYDAPATAWQRVQDAGILADDQIAQVEQRIAGVNPADLTRQINQIRSELCHLAKTKTEALAAGKPLDLKSLTTSINRLAPKIRKPKRAQRV